MQGRQLLLHLFSLCRLEGKLVARALEPAVLPGEVVDHLVAHDLLLVVDGLSEASKLLGLCQFTLQLLLLVLAVRLLEHLQLLRGVLHPALNQVDFVAHQPEAPLHLLLHRQDLRRDQRRKGWVWLRH